MLPPRGPIDFSIQDLNGTSHERLTQNLQILCNDVMSLLVESLYSLLSLMWHLSFVPLLWLKGDE